MVATAESPAMAGWVLIVFATAWRKLTQSPPDRPGVGSKESIVFFFFFFLLVRGGQSKAAVEEFEF